MLRTLPEWLIVDVLDSKQRSNFAHRGHDFSFVQQDGYAELAVAEPTGPPLYFSIDQLSGVLVFKRRLARGLMYTDASVVLGEESIRFMLGPEVHIDALEIVIDARQFSVEVGREGEISSLRAGSYVVSGNLSIDAPRPRDFLVEGGDAWPALRPFSAPQRNYTGFLSFADYMDLRAILRCFRQGAGSSPSVFNELLEQRIVQRNPKRRKFLNRLIEEGLVVKRPSHHYLDLDKFAGRGINLASINDGEPSAQVRDLINTLR